MRAPAFRVPPVGLTPLTTITLPRFRPMTASFPLVGTISGYKRIPLVELPNAREPRPFLYWGVRFLFVHVNLIDLGIPSKGGTYVVIN